MKKRKLYFVVLSKIESEIVLLHHNKWQDDKQQLIQTNKKQVQVQVQFTNNTNKFVVTS